MGAYEGDRYPFLDEAVGLIGAAVRRDMPYLGICLGGQLLARALGAQVTRAPASEIGLIEITVRPESRADPLLVGLGPVIETVQFHQDTFSMPHGSTLLASSALCRTQIVRCAPRAYALQFHPEASAATFASWIDHYLRHFDDRSQVALGHSRSDEVRRHDAAIRDQATQLFDNFIRLAVPAHAAR
jgi:GMP synthase-like glutamine amidotransferase